MGNFPGISPYALLVILYGVMVAMISFVGSFGTSGRGQASKSFDCCVLWRFCLSCFRCPKCVAIVEVRNFVAISVVNPGHD